MAEGPFKPHAEKMDKEKKKAVKSHPAEDLIEVLHYRDQSGLGIEQNEPKLHEKRIRSAKSKLTSNLLREKDKEQAAAAKVAARAARESRIVNQDVPLNKRVSFITDRRVTAEELEDRKTWLESHKSSIFSRSRGVLLYEVRYPDYLHGIYALRYSPDGEYIVTGYGSGAIQVRNGTNGNLMFGVKAGMDKTSPVMGFRFHPKHTDRFFAASSDGVVFLCDTNEGDFQSFCVEPDNETNALDINLTGDSLVTGGRDGHIRVYDTETSKISVLYARKPHDISSAVHRFHRLRVYAIHYHYLMRETFVTGGWDNYVKVWDQRDRRGCVRQFFGPHLCGDAIDIKDNNLVTGSWIPRDSLQLWDFRSGDLIANISPENSQRTEGCDYLYATQYFTGDPYEDMVIIAGSGLTFVEIISLTERKVLGSFPVTKSVMTVDSNNRFITFGGMEPILRIVDFA